MGEHTDSQSAGNAGGLLPGAPQSLSPEVLVALWPWTAWRHIAKAPESRHWLARPMFALFVYGCAASLMASGRATLRIALPSMLYATFAPLLQMAALGLLCRGRLPFRRAVELFFAGHLPVSLLMLAFGSTWAFAPAHMVYARFGIWSYLAMGALAWSAHIDYWFFRRLCAKGPWEALGVVTAHRFLWSIPALAIFVGPAAWQEAIKWVGL